MINDNTILSSFDDRPTLLEWLKKVEEALKTDTATAVSVENPSANTYVFKITFADGDSISSGNVVFPDSVKDVSIKNGHIIVTSVGGNVEDLGAINPYAGTIVVNAQTNDVEINGETKINAGLEVLNEINCDNIVAKGAIQTDTDLAVTGNAQVNGRLQVNSSIISNGEIRGGNISGTKFLLGTEEMPLVKANPTGEATETLEKVKIGDVAYNVGGGGGGAPSFHEITISATELTPSQTKNNWASFPASLNSEIDLLFEGVNAFQSMKLVYPNNEGYMSFRLDSANVEGASKILSYDSGLMASPIQVRKDEGENAYSFVIDTSNNVTEFLGMLETIVLTKLA